MMRRRAGTLGPDQNQPVYRLAAVWMLGVEVIQDAYKIRGFLGRPPFLAARTGPDRGGCR